MNMIFSLCLLSLPVAFFYLDNLLVTYGELQLEYVFMMSKVWKDWFENALHFH